MKNKNSQNSGKDCGVPWKKILLEIYNSSPNSYGESIKETFNSTNHLLAKTLKIKGEELHKGMVFLYGQKLIQSHDVDALDAPKTKFQTHLELTEKGFSVAMDLEKHKDSYLYQLSIFFLTAMLVMTGAFGLLFNISNIKGLIILIIYICLFLAFLLIHSNTEKNFFNF